MNNRLTNTSTTRAAAVVAPKWHTTAFIRHMDCGMLTVQALQCLRDAGITTSMDSVRVLFTVEDFNGGARLSTSVPAKGIVTAKRARAVARELIARLNAYRAELDVQWELHNEWKQSLREGVASVDNHAEAKECAERIGKLRETRRHTKNGE